MSPSTVTEPQVETLLTGLLLGESPRWHDGRLWFSDWGAGEIMTVDPAGAHETILPVRALPFSLDFLPDGRMLIVANSAVLCREADGAVRPYADLSALSTKPWNEIVIDGRGNAYVNTINFDFPGGAFQPGIVALVTPDGRVRQVADDVAFPNGMAVTPDNATLILAESYGNRLTAFDIDADGGLSGRRVWATLEGCYPDGICLDAEGAVWYADVPNRRCVRVSAGGAVLQSVAVDRGCFACMLGGADGRTLFILAAEWHGVTDSPVQTGVVLTARVSVPAAGWP
ncbi:SMP-30/gluconolactonase/LRE family protein [Kaistia dalseonensis]|uniref:Sugar lactone lactonase YvrE n=1 Tax=Kaistia dalseonensis TaxID=410840 RepID=A0ABU0H3I1_9HYPH|nr:SMP-30/gluconolactonase/LRE family protein [Kaistia dalseonensis]MCX5493472.1 SMP-30/gluconolactonase/LRE family protein [Kaistia dalseonensis]MDQ0436031.1 sugar lactone lactonase YvrE [Kaistia dalseonensis]